MSNTLPDTKPFSGFEWQLAFRYLRPRRKEGIVSVISMFSFLGIMIGVAALIVVMSVFNGFHNELLNKVLGYTGHVTVYDPQFNPIPDSDAIKKRLAETAHVKKAIAVVEGQVMASSAKTATGALVRGMSEEDVKKLSSLNNENLRTGIRNTEGLDETPSFDGWDKSDGVAIGERMAWKHQLGIGTTITLISPNGPETPMGSTPRIRDYPIRAIFKMGMSEYDENVVYMPLAEAQDFFSWEAGVTALEIDVDDPEAVQAYLADIRAATGKDLMLQTWKERNQAFFSALIMERNLVFLVVTMVVLVAALNIISGLTMLVKDKGHDIAILRTMGATKGTIMRVFLVNGATIGVLGIIAGTLLGLLIAWNAEPIRKFIQFVTGVNPLNEDLYYLSKITARIEPMQVLFIILMTLVLTFLASVYPAWRASKLDPVEALRYE